MRIVFGHDETVAKWVGSALGKPFHAPYTAFGLIDKDGYLRAGFVFTGYNGDAIEMSLAGGACLTRGAMRAVAQYVFHQLKCSRLQIHTPRKNKRVRKLAPKFGFKYEGVARRLYGEQDAFTYAITSDDMPLLQARWRL